MRKYEEDALTERNNLSSQIDSLKNLQQSMRESLEHELALVTSARYKEKEVNERELKQAQETIKNYHKDIIKLNKSNSIAQANIKGLNNTVYEISKELKLKDNEFNNCREQLKQALSENKKLKDQAANLLREGDVMEKKIREKELEVKKLKSECKDNNEYINKLEIQRSQSKEYLATTNNSLEEIKTKYKDIKEYNERIEREKEKLNKIYEDNVKTLETITSDYKTQQDALLNLKEKFDTLHSNHLQLQGQLKRSEESECSLQKDKEEAKSVFDTITTIYNQELLPLLESDTKAFGFNTFTFSKFLIDTPLSTLLHELKRFTEYIKELLENVGQVSLETNIELKRLRDNADKIETELYSKTEEIMQRKDREQHLLNINRNLKEQLVTLEKDKTALTIM